jgi:hypothetical protein
MFMDKPMKTWRVKLVSQTFRLGNHLFLMLVGMMAIVALFQVNIDPALFKILGGGVGALAVIMMVFLALRVQRGKQGILTLEGGMLRLKARGENQELSLQGASVVLTKHFSTQSDRYLMGSLLTIKVPGTAGLAILGAGVELQSDAYEQDGESYGVQYDFYMESEDFKDLQRSISPISLGAGGGTLGTLNGRTLTFEAFAIRSLSSFARPVIIWLGGAAIVGMLAFAAMKTFGADELGEAGGLIVLAVALPLLLLVSYLVTRSKPEAHKLELRAGRLRILKNDREVRAIVGDPRELILGQYHVRSRYSSFYSGPCLQMRDSIGRRLVISISDSSVIWDKPSKRTHRGHFMISRDAGDALALWLASINPEIAPKLLSIK